VRALAALVVFPLGVLLIAGASCVSSPLPLPPGGVRGQVALDGVCPAANTYAVVPISDCPFLSCDGATVVYALCDGMMYSACDCTNPGDGWTYDGKDFVPAPPGDAGGDTGGCEYQNSGLQIAQPWVCYCSACDFMTCSNSYGESSDAGDFGTCCVFEGVGPSSCAGGETTVCCSSEDPSSCTCEKHEIAGQSCYSLVGYPGDSC
jgi:hypothetical protein